MASKMPSNLLPWRVMHSWIFLRDYRHTATAAIGDSSSTDSRDVRSYKITVLLLFSMLVSVFSSQAIMAEADRRHIALLELQKSSGNANDVQYFHNEIWKIIECKCFCWP